MALDAEMHGLAAAVDQGECARKAARGDPGVLKVVLQPGQALGGHADGLGRSGDHFGRHGGLLLVGAGLGRSTAIVQEPDPRFHPCPAQAGSPSRAFRRFTSRS